MSDDDVTTYFEAQLAEMVPGLVHAIAFHSKSPGCLVRLAAVSQLLTSFERAERLAWEISIQMQRTILAQVPVREVQVVPAVTENGQAKVIGIDDAAPPHRAANRYLQCAMNGDRETAKAVFATIDSDEDIDAVIKTILWHAGIVTAQLETCPR